MKNYISFEMPEHTIHISEVYVRIGEHVATIQHKIGGNCLGESILNSAIRHVADWEFSTKDVKFGSATDNEDGVAISLTLYHENSGRPLTIHFDEDDDRILRDHIVGAQIVNWQED